MIFSSYFLKYGRLINYKTFQNFGIEEIYSDFQGAQEQGIMAKTTNRRVPRSEYRSFSQLTLVVFETSFYNQLDPNNPGVVLSKKIPWDKLVGLFLKHNPVRQTGLPH